MVNTVIGQSDGVAVDSRKTRKAEDGRRSETDPTGRPANSPGSKLDAGKSPVFRGAVGYFPRALRAVADVSAFGASKYQWKGWESVPDGINRYSDAMVRHLTSEGQGQVEDHDSGFLEAAHVAWNSLARLELMLREIENVGA